MQCIICLEEEDEILETREIDEIDETHEINRDRIRLLRCISSKNCTFCAHQKCIFDWHKTINKYECPICHFILPNEIVNNNHTPTIETGTSELSRTRIIDIESDDDDFILNRVIRFNLHHPERVIRVDRLRPPTTLIRTEYHLNELVRMRHDRIYLTGMCMCILSMCFLTGIFTFLK